MYTNKHSLNDESPPQQRGRFSSFFKGSFTPLKEDVHIDQIPLHGIHETPPPGSGDILFVKSTEIPRETLKGEIRQNVL